MTLIMAFVLSHSGQNIAEIGARDVVDSYNDEILSRGFPPDGQYRHECLKSDNLRHTLPIFRAHHRQNRRHGSGRL